MKTGETFNPYKLFVGIFTPRALARYKGISQGAKLCYGALSYFAGENGQAWPSHETLGEELGVTSRQVRDYLSELKEKGFIKTDRTQKTNKYYFIWHEVLEQSMRREEYFPPEGENISTRKDTSASTRKDTSDKENHLREPVKREDLKDDEPVKPPVHLPGKSSSYTSTDEEQKPKPGAATEPDPEPKPKQELYEAIDYYIELFTAETGQKPHINPGKDHKLLKKIITSRGIDGTLELLEVYFKTADSWTIEKQGYSIGNFYANMNRLIVSKANGGLTGAAGATMNNLNKEGFFEGQGAEYPKASKKGQKAYDLVEKIRQQEEAEAAQGPVMEAEAWEVKQGPEEAQEEAQGDPEYDPETNTVRIREAVR